MSVFSRTTALYVGNNSYSAAYVGDVQVWPSEIDYSRQYMTFDILSSGTIMFKSNNATAITKEIQYSINNGSWITFNSSGNTGFTVSAGDKVRFKGENARYGTLGATSPRATFLASTAIFDVYGNIMSMVYGDNFIGQTELDPGGYNFIGFFNGAKVVNAENLILPMETIPDRAFINFMLDSPMLKYAPKVIPATTIGVLGMQGAFARCPELERASEYSVTNVGASAFTQTYLQDTKLVQAPSVLPIETMGGYACNGMFQGCTSLVNAPELPCTALTSNCYRQMFQDCSSLMYIKCLAVDKSATNTTYLWVRNVNTSGGTFVYSSGATWSTGESAIPTNWVAQPYPPVPPPVSGDYLTFEILTGGTIQLSGNCASAQTVQYRVNNGSWNTMTVCGATASDAITVNAGDIVEWKGNNNVYNKSIFKGTVKCNILGNILSLIYGDSASGYTTLPNYDDIFSHLFERAGIISAEHLILPSNVRDYCYDHLFEGCTSLVKAPALPATALTKGCYFYMFEWCNNLTSMPLLPATTLAEKCYHGMFHYCRSLINVYELPSTNLAIDCYTLMFSQCTSLVNAPALPATALIGWCYQEMFSYCTSLVNAPALPAATLARSCYRQMFDHCTSLVNAPQLLANKLSTYCYYYMFNGCTKLNNIKCTATDISASNATYKWLKDVAASGTFTKAAGVSWSSGGDGIPTGWTVIEE